MATGGLLILDYFQQFLISAITSLSVELIAALSGSYYLMRNLKVNTANKFIVYFLWLTFSFDLIGSYAPIAYFSNYEYFDFICITGRFEYNHWWFNIYMLISYSFFIYYFTSFLIKNKVKHRMHLLIFCYLIVGVGNLMVSKIFFNGSSILSSTLGTLIVLFSIFLFFFDLLKSDKILILTKYLPIYIAVGVLVNNIALTPMAIFSQYFIFNNELFINIKAALVPIVNVIMYGLFTIGFLKCSKNKNNCNELRI